MKKSFAWVVRSMLESIHRIFRTRKEPRITPEQFRELFAQTMSDTANRWLFLRGVFLQFPAEGGSCPTLGAGSGIMNNYLTKWTDVSSCTISDSAVIESAGQVGIAITSPAIALDVAGEIASRSTMPIYAWVDADAATQEAATGLIYNQATLSLEERPKAPPSEK